MKRNRVVIGSCELHPATSDIKGNYVELNGEHFYRIQNYDHMEPFFMSVVSDSNHWLFVSSNGALTCGRRNPESALFPYSTDDRIHDAQDQTGPKTMVIIEHNDIDHLWKPFSDRYAGAYNIERNLYKNIPGNQLMFEEINHSLQVAFRYTWMSSDRYGFVRKAELVNLGDTAAKYRLIDGLQNLQPAQVEREMQTVFSTLVDAYKKTELLPKSGIGIFALSSVPVDRAEPSEALTANTVWSIGLNNPIHLLSTRQLGRFRRGEPVEQETKVHGIRGAYLVYSELELTAGETKEWFIVAEVDQTASDIAKLEQRKPDGNELLEDIQNGTDNLCKIVAQADGIQTGGDPLQTARHFANTLFNVMRGGIFDDNYRVDKNDLLDFFQIANRPLLQELQVDSLPSTFDYAEGLVWFQAMKNPIVERLYLEYLPLTFSRRHGDPSRPWNRFSIETRNDDGSKKLFYQGNWRDIFQNWEALGISYPGFLESMVCKFVNASTPDGYNPYRITRNGIDWEVHDPNDPWSYIGYWGDHQIIYLLKLMEQSEAYHPGHLQELLSRDIFVYANVPYRIKPYADLLANPRDSIEFDDDAHDAIMALSKTIGSDGKLIHIGDSGIYRVNLTEKILIPLLAKLSNFIPEAGIWMNTQRPEWNDANNALVGYGVSMVTLYYIRRYLDFCIDLFENCDGSACEVSNEVLLLFQNISSALENHKDQLSSGFNNMARRNLLDSLGGAGESYRHTIYSDGFSGIKTKLSTHDILTFLKRALEYMDQTISANRRDDGLYHAYNLMSVESDGGISIRHLYEMLEGQVAVLSSGKLTAAESLDVLNALRTSPLYREDQHSYILYPYRNLQPFMEKNRIPDITEAHPDIATKDCNGIYHFNPEFRNEAVLQEKLETMGMPESEIQVWLERYEQVFDHQSFTGRSGTFFKYEGLGSIYWHMVSKLLLAVQDICIREKESELIQPLMERYYDIRQGIGGYKSVEEQGAFPTDPYSHTPAMMGAQQPGLTGQVKEDFISRLVEIGVRVKGGRLGFDPFLSTENDVRFTICSVPVTIHKDGRDVITVVRADGEEVEIQGSVLNDEFSREIFNRSGAVKELRVTIRTS